jgi:ATP-dependent RNA helicase SUPV3L1/SUV3
LVDAPHEMFELDARGRILAQGEVLGRLVRGANLAAPNVELAALDGISAGLKLRLQRRLLAFARDSVNRYSHALEGLRRSDKAALRAIAYQLERGLGTASTRDLQASLAVLDAEAREVLRHAGVEIGELAVFQPASLRRAALVLRTLLTAVFHPELDLPVLGKPTYETRTLSAGIWLCLGYVALGSRACRVDLAERAADALGEGASETDALRCLSIPKRDTPRVARALREYLLPPAREA